MKKFLSLILALMLVLSLGATAFAAPARPDYQHQPQDTGANNAADAAVPTFFAFKKVWLGADGQPIAKNYFPEGAPLSFKAEFISGPVAADKAPMLEVKDTEAIANNTQNSIIVNVPAYDQVGKYFYKITEIDPNNVKPNSGAAGVVYSQQPVYVTVAVTNNENGEGLQKVITFYGKDAAGKEIKVDKIENHLNLGSVTIDKQVTGNLADKNQDFLLHVTVTSEKQVFNRACTHVFVDASGHAEEYEAYPGMPTVPGGPIDPTSGNWKVVNGKYVFEFDVKNSHVGEALTVKNIPYGAVVTVTEDKEHVLQENENAAELENNPAKGYAVKYTGNDAAVDGTVKNIVVTNEKGTTVNTGVILDSAPYILALTIAVLGVVLFVSKKRRVED